ncbi:MAG TPA: hypothetical protein VNQ79_20645 [Blastocatellia bacterium]|nr:hypothetical protein [Blastocatellia bacterium]
MTHKTPRTLRPLLLLLCTLCLLPGRHGLTRATAPQRDAAPPINPELLTKLWSAHWITAPGMPPFDYGVCHFRRTFNLSERPSSFVIHVTGDNRYQLFVNGERVVWGPARGDLNHWRYETVDLAPFLKAGKNVLAAVVWNYGQFAPEAQITWRTDFLLQGELAVNLAQNSGRLKAEVRLPAGVTGTFIWQGQQRELKPGSNTLNF